MPYHLKEFMWLHPTMLHTSHASLWLRSSDKEMPQKIKFLARIILVGIRLIERAQSYHFSVHHHPF
jgi:hypothetical protein